MIDNLQVQVVSVAGPRGEQMTMKDLPASNTDRWIARRKAEVVAAVKGGMLSFSDACDRYQLSPQEFATWEQAVEKDGIAGLRASKTQEYRDSYARNRTTLVPVLDGAGQ